MKERLGDLEEQLESSNRKYKTAVSEHELTIAELRQTVHELQEKCEHGQKRVVEIRTELSNHITSKDEELSSIRSETEMLRLHKRELEGEVESLTDQLEKAECELQEQRTELDKLYDNDSEFDNAQQTINELRLSLKSRDEKLTKMEDQLANKRRELSENIMQLTNQREELSMVRAAHKKLESNKKKQDAVIETKNAELKQLQAQIAKLVKDLSHMQAQVGDNQNEHASLREQVDSLQTELETTKQAFASAETFTKQNRTQEETGTKLLSLTKNLSKTQELNERLKLRLEEVETELEAVHTKQIRVYAGDNCYHLYQARYAYDSAIFSDPDSPNKSTDRSDRDSALPSERADLSVNAGDYVFVTSKVIEDGFYESYLLDGRSGLLPSNVLEPLYEFDIYGFILATETDGNEECVNGFDDSIPELEITSSLNLLPSSVKPSYPYPRKPVLERQFANSIVIGWMKPEEGSASFYNVYVDDEFRVSVNGRATCTALVSDVKSGEPHRISVTATTTLGMLLLSQCHAG